MRRELTTLEALSTPISMWRSGYSASSVTAIMSVHLLEYDLPRKIMILAFDGCSATQEAILLTYKIDSQEHYENHYTVFAPGLEAPKSSTLAVKVEVWPRFPLGIA